MLVENCTLWTAPLGENAGEFRAGERPGENAVDTKQRASNVRSRMTIRRCLMHGWEQPGQIGNMAALNLKNHVDVRVEDCVLHDNEICFRVRGGNGEYGGATVTIENCAVYNSQVAIRAEDGIENLAVRGLGIGTGISEPFVAAGKGTRPELRNEGAFEPPPLARVLREGLPRSSGR